MSETVGALLAAKRKVVAGICEWCGKPIQGLRTKKYCDNKCRQAMKYAKNREKNMSK